MTYTAWHSCKKCPTNFFKMYKRWPFLRDFGARCPKCDAKSWPTSVREQWRGKEVQHN